MERYPEEFGIGRWTRTETGVTIEGTNEQEKQKERPWCQARGLCTVHVRRPESGIVEGDRMGCVPAKATQRCQVFLSKVTAEKMQVKNESG